MKSFFVSKPGCSLTCALAVALFFAVFPTAGMAAAAGSGGETNTPGQAWLAVQQSARLSPPPLEWQRQRPTEKEIAEFNARQMTQLRAAADKARDFSSRFPGDTNALDALRLEYAILNSLYQAGATDLLARVEMTVRELERSPQLTTDDRFQMRWGELLRTANQRAQTGGLEAKLDALEKGATTLQKEFPQRPEIFQLLLEISTYSDVEKARQLAQRVADNAPVDELKLQAQSWLARLDRVGKPLELKFKALDGQAVDLASLRGKVVLVDFWATWCVPCVRGLPEVKALYEKWHAKGLEIVAISLDADEAALNKFLAREKLPWPQYFDGLAWQNKFARQFGIQSIPELWLVDKKGVLRDLRAREGLAAKVETMLAEK